MSEEDKKDAKALFELNNALSVYQNAVNLLIDAKCSGDGVRVRDRAIGYVFAESEIREKILDLLGDANYFIDLEVG